MSRHYPPVDPADPRDTLDMLFALLPNVLNQVNRIGGTADGQPIPLYDRSVGYDDVFRNTGAYPEWLNQVLGLLGGVAEPGPGEIGQAGRLLGDLAPTVAAAVRSGTARSRGLLDNDLYRHAAPNPGVVVPPGFRTVEGADLRRYVDAIERMPADRRGFLTPYTIEELQAKVANGAQVRMTDDGVGYILDNGDLQGVINASNRRGAGREAVEDAIRNGATTLDAYDGFLPNFYRQFGFEETGRASWDDRYAAPNWDYGRYGRPDVVFMRRRGAGGGGR